MAEERVSFKSENLTIAGTVRVPAGVAPRERRPAFLVLHGFGSNMTSSNVMAPCAMLEKLGYVTLRFDMPGCGESEGDKGHLICLDQVATTSAALTFLSKHPNVEPERIGAIGSSFGAAVAVYAGGVDKRGGAGISSGGRGDGEREVKGPQSDPGGGAEITGRAGGGQ